MSSARARGGLHCKWIVPIKSHSGPQQNGLRFHLEGFFFDLLPFCPSFGHCCQMSSWFFSLDGQKETKRKKERKKGWLKLQPCGIYWKCHLDEMRNFNRTSLSFPVVHGFHAPIRQGCGRYKQGGRRRNSSAKSPRCTWRTLPKWAALQNEVG